MMDPDRGIPPHSDERAPDQEQRGEAAPRAGGAAHPPRYPGCVYLGTVTIDGTSAHLYVCQGLAVARFGDGPGEVEAQHLHTLDADASPFLLAAFRLHLERLAPRLRSLGDALVPQAAMSN